MAHSAILKKIERQENFRKKFSEFEEMKQLGSVASDDIKKIRNQIEVVSKDYLEAQKKFEKAEREYLEARAELLVTAEQKDRLSETLRAVILRSEVEKAQKISSLLGKLEIRSKPVVLTDQDTGTDKQD